MPFYEIPPAQIEALPLFGYDDIGPGPNGFVWYRAPDGRRMLVDTAKPIVWIEDPADAIQLHATAVLVSAKPEL